MTANHVGSRVSSMDIWIDMIVRYVISGICDTKSWWKWFWLGALPVRLASLITFHEIQKLITTSEVRTLKFSQPIANPIRIGELGFGNPKFSSNDNLYICNSIIELYLKLNRLSTTIIFTVLFRFIRDATIWMWDHASAVCHRVRDVRTIIYIQVIRRHTFCTVYFTIVTLNDMSRDNLMDRQCVRWPTCRMQCASPSCHCIK